MFVKIFTAGHEVPSDKTILSFKRVVQRFLQDNSDNGPLRISVRQSCLGGSTHAGEMTAAPLSFSVFPSSNADKLIGVHCTHGLNRTGYLICRSARSQFAPSRIECVICIKQLCVWTAGIWSMSMGGRPKKLWSVSSKGTVFCCISWAFLHINTIVICIF